MEKAVDESATSIRAEAERQAVTPGNLQGHEENPTSATFNTTEGWSAHTAGSRAVIGCG